MRWCFFGGCLLLTALKAGRNVTVFSAKFWNLDHQIGAACSKWGEDFNMRTNIQQ